MISESRRVFSEPAARVLTRTGRSVCGAELCPCRRGLSHRQVLVAQHKWTTPTQGTKLHFKSLTAERRHFLCVGDGKD